MTSVMRLVALAPDRGSTQGGLRVVASAQGLEGDVWIEVDGVRITCASLGRIFQMQKIAFVTPKHPEPGTVAIRIVTADKSTDPVIFTYEQEDEETLSERLGSTATVERVSLIPSDSPIDAGLEPMLLAVSPSHGLVAGGTEVILDGMHLPKTSRVFFGDIEAQLTAVSAVQIQAITPPCVRPERVDIRLISPDAPAVVLPGSFTYQRPGPPRVSQIEPREGSASGGENVTIRGSGFDPRTQIEFAGIPGKIVNFSPTEMVVETPRARVLGPIPVCAQNLDGQFDAVPAGFTYLMVLEAPRIDSIEPSRITVGEAATAIIQGAGFREGTQIWIGDVLTEVTVLATDRLSVVIAPRRVAGKCDLRAKNPDGQSGEAEGLLTVGMPRPDLVIADVRPLRGPTIGGTKIRLTGGPFPEGSRITFDQVPIETQFDGRNALLCVSPARKAGPMQLAVVSPDGRKTEVIEPFVYEMLPPPTIESLEPRSGTMRGGWVLTVYGSAFLDGAQVVIGTAVAKTKRIDATRLDATIPALPNAGLADVGVKNPDGQVVRQQNAIRLDR